MRDSNLVVRLSDSEREIVDQLQNKHAINISQYVRNKLVEIDKEVNEMTTYIPIRLNTKTQKILKELKDEFHCDPIKILKESLDDESISDILHANISAIHLKYKRNDNEIHNK